MVSQFYCIQINEDTCLGCGNCIAACPLSNPESPIFSEGNRKIKLESGVAKKFSGVVCWDHPKVPDDCEECASLCPTESIKAVED